MSSARSSGSGASDWMMLRSERPSTYSIAMYIRLFSRGFSTLTTLGCSSFCPISSSRLKRSKKTTSLSSCGCGILSATWAPLSPSTALKIDAIPLRAKSSPSSY